MSGAAILQATAQNVKYAGKNGHEQELGVLPRDFGLASGAIHDSTPRVGRAVLLHKLC